VQQKIVYAGSNSRSFEKASCDLQELSELAISTKQVERVCQRIGEERCAERDEAVRLYQTKPLVERKGVPQGLLPPTVAAVSVDGAVFRFSSALVKRRNRWPAPRRPARKAATAPTGGRIKSAC